MQICVNSIKEVQVQVFLICTKYAFVLA